MPPKKMQVDNFAFDKFDMSTMKMGHIAVFQGRRGAGKSVISREVASLFTDRLEVGIAMSPTAPTRAEWVRMMPRQLIYKEYNREAISRVIALMQDKTSNYEDAVFEKEVMGEGDGKPIKEVKNIFIWLDDCSYDEAGMRSKDFREIFNNGRHLKINLWYNMQSSTDLLPKLRLQVDYQFLMGGCTGEELRKVHKMAFNQFFTLSEFERVYKVITEDFGCMVLNNTAGLENNVRSRVFWYKSEDKKEYPRLCKRKWWEMSAAKAKPKSKGSNRQAGVNGVVLLPVKPPAESSRHRKRASKRSNLESVEETDEHCKVHDNEDNNSNPNLDHQHHRHDQHQPANDNDTPRDQHHQYASMGGSRGTIPTRTHGSFDPPRAHFARESDREHAHRGGSVSDYSQNTTTTTMRGFNDTESEALSVESRTDGHHLQTQPMTLSSRRHGGSVVMSTVNSEANAVGYKRSASGGNARGGHPNNSTEMPVSKRQRLMDPNRSRVRFDR
jgi:hypothetical protein